MTRFLTVWSVCLGAYVVGGMWVGECVSLCECMCVRTQHASLRSCERARMCVCVFILVPYNTSMISLGGKSSSRHSVATACI